jgi:hypothetical protein
MKPSKKQRQNCSGLKVDKSREQVFKMFKNMFFHIRFDKERIGKKVFKKCSLSGFSFKVFPRSLAITEFVLCSSMLLILISYLPQCCSIY